ncbi:hypothetical protein [Halorubrum sp. HHNYT27]|uniref:hypothetical protein n=1 Tax=Halorubrum sp. HHNYT27 TaxID=3402275 RepID=UPI003EBA1198
MRSNSTDGGAVYLIGVRPSSSLTATVRVAARRISARRVVDHRVGEPRVETDGASEAFKPRGDDAVRMRDMESVVLDQDPEVLAPVVVLATIALLAVFVLGFLIQAIGLVI